MDIKAYAKFVKGSDQKIKRVLDIVRRKGVEESLALLKFVPGAAAGHVYNLINSALANAKQLNLNPGKLYIKEIFVNKGPMLKRFRAGSRGIAKPVRHRTSHLTVVLGERGEI